MKPLTFTPGRTHGPQEHGVETMPQINLPEGGDVCLMGYFPNSARSRKDRTPTMERRNELGALIVSVFNARPTAGELATILAALRHWQRRVPASARGQVFAEHFADAKPLSNHAIDKLCDKLNR